MGSIYHHARDGTLTSSHLVGKEKEIDSVTNDHKLTPLGAAVWSGHKQQIKLLLRNGANPNGAYGTRPPLWVATSRTQKHVGRIVEILLDNKADPKLPSTFDGNSTPLLNAVKSFQSPDVISALVDAGASPTAPNNKGETAKSVAEKRKDRASLGALLPRSQRFSTRLQIVLVLSGLMTFIVAWANEHYKTAAAAAATVIGASLISGAIEKRFHWSGVYDPLIPAKYRSPTPETQFMKDIQGYITEAKLEKFFPPDNEFLDKVVKKAIKLKQDPKNTLPVRDLTRVALYQPVLYCDDSGSMTEDRRNKYQNELVQRIASITTRLVPDGEGIELRFINKETDLKMTKPDLRTINKIMESLSFDGWTEIGTNLRKKVLEDVVYKPLRDETFKRPVLISIITDGCPAPEKQNTLKGAILECGEVLKRHGYDPKVVRFQISQIGSDKDAKKFLKTLNSDPALTDVLYCTAKRLDDEFKGLRDNEWRLE